MRILCRTSLFLLLLITAATYIFHVGVVPAPLVAALTPAEISDAGEFISRHDPLELGLKPIYTRMNHLILRGSAYARGKRAGELTAGLLKAQEQELVGRLRTWIPWTPVLETLVLTGIVWFDGVQNYFERWQTDEMYGVSQAAPADFNYLIDPFTRQLAYHGLHEVGQLLVDQGREDLGCTVFAIPHENSWLVGRNFDFEAGRIFDREKIVKWVFPDVGYKYVSVIWAGMVGAVTGVNENGIYISINAAGSRDFQRIGTPSTLVLLKVLQFARTADEALKILKDSAMFITDIFVLVDAKNAKAYRIEKSPLRTFITSLRGPSVITNHLLAPEFQEDKINIFRRDELTSGTRTARGQFLMDHLGNFQKWTSDTAHAQMLAFLRDKTDVDGARLALGNRRAIDALIATHSVIYDGALNLLFISQGPGISGPFTGYDLAASFSRGRPTVAGELQADPLVDAETFEAIHATSQAVAAAEKQTRRHRGHEALIALDQIPEALRTSSEYYLARGNALNDEHRSKEAKNAWTRALELRPAYARTTREIEERLK